MTKYDDGQVLIQVREVKGDPLPPTQIRFRQTK